MSERKPLVLLDGAVRQLPQGDTIAGGTDAELTARFDTYRTVAANGTGFPKGAGILDFAANGTLVVLSPDGSPIEAYYNGGYMPLPSGVSHQFTNAFSGYVVALPGEDALTAIVSPPNLNHRIVAWVGYNPDSPDPWWYAGFEMHTPARNPDAHLLHHLETGMTWLSGGELTRQDESDPQNARFALTNVSVADEDLHFTIENDTAQDSYTTHLLRFDGEANDAVTGAIWYKNNAVAFQPSGRAEFGQCAAWTAGVSVWFSRAAPALRRSDFTLEAWVNIESVSPGYNGTNAAPLFSFLNGNNWNGQALVL
ncbi:MAG: hypothetical protein LBD68_06165, partial [Zoogloeaceae bacterium]|nr:hypothetical protein [Zoogloeaceae bacterium]